MNVWVEGWGTCYGESSDTLGLVLGPKWWREICIRGVETSGGGVVVKQAGEVGGDSPFDGTEYRLHLLVVKQLGRTLKGAC